VIFALAGELHYIATGRGVDTWKKRKKTKTKQQGRMGGKMP